MKLTPEQITELLAGEDKIKPNAVGTYTPRRHAPPKQVGPVRFLNDGKTNKCLHQYKGRFCLAPAFVTFKGRYHCLLHAAIECNELLVTMGVLE